jgi:hypothetical protein
MFTSRRTPRTSGVLLITALLVLAGCGGDAGSDATQTTVTTAPQDAASTAPEAPVTTGAPDDPSVLNGTYRLEWTPEDLNEATGMVGDELEANSGVYTLTLEDGEFDQVWDNAISAGDHCRGTYVVNGNRLLMTASSDINDWDCGGEDVGIDWVDAAWELTDDQLILSDFAPTVEDLHLLLENYLGSKPLTRID